MAFSASLTPDITESLPALLSAREEAQSFSINSTQYDVAIGGVPFLSAVSDQRPYVRQTAAVQKQQFDSSRDAGEQTLDQFWLRSQTSWHRGAGITFYEPGTDELTPYRFAESQGVNVWTQGEVSLLKRTTKVGPVSPGQSAYATTARLSDGTDVSMTVENGTVRRRTATGVTSLTGVTAETPVATAGSYALVGAGTSIYRAAISGAAFAPLWTGAAELPVPFWAKSRIIAAVGPSLYELTMAGGTWPTDAVFTHPDSEWTWTAVAEAPSAILVAGHGGGNGAVFRLALEDAPSGQTPKLSQAYQVAELPPGEEIHAMRVYLGAYVGLGTSRGVRVGIVSGSGEIQAGPLTVETQYPVRSLAARDSFLYAAVDRGMPDGTSGCVRINLGEQLEDLRFPYAFDVQTHTTGVVRSVAFLGNSGRVVLGVESEGVYLESDTQYETTGYVLSGKVRYGTVEQKGFKLADLGLRVPDGSVRFAAIDATNEVFIRAITNESSDGSSLSLANPPGTHEYLSFRITLTCSTDGLVTPVVESLQVKAIPAPARQRLVQFPLMCFDLERPGSGAPFGREGFAWSRVAALEEVESARATVQVQDFVTGETFDAQVEEVEFTRTGPRSGDNRPNFGGFLKVTVRRL